MSMELNKESVEQAGGDERAADAKPCATRCPDCGEHDLMPGDLCACGYETDPATGYACSECDGSGEGCVGEVCRECDGSGWFVTPDQASAALAQPSPAPELSGTGTTYESLYRIASDQLSKANERYGDLYARYQKRVAELERQEPVALANRGLHAFWVKWTEAAAGLYGPGIKLYAAPVAQAQHSVPEEFIGRLSEFLAQRGTTGKALLRELRAMLAAAPAQGGE
ncbi:hypothetical protein FNL65_21895 [Pseudomonas aeruginosa]|uniref:hypothetical protein n=1 Tax=Pseudomonas aeruginosa TaxID=287 RepID=UPI00115C6190|nr:hypothetical protein [Pseudomonas aeruginosa]TRM01016.1 hypothetical protein FNL65_21895 [Pseudomonas aeruginosa]